MGFHVRRKPCGTLSSGLVRGRKDAFVGSDLETKKETVTWSDGSVNGNLHRTWLCSSGMQLLLCLVLVHFLDKFSSTRTKLASSMCASVYYSVMVQLKPYSPPNSRLSAPSQDDRAGSPGARIPRKSFSHENSLWNYVSPK